MCNIEACVGKVLDWLDENWLRNGRRCKIFWRLAVGGIEIFDVAALLFGKSWKAETWYAIVINERTVIGTLTNEVQLGISETLASSIVIL